MTSKDTFDSAEGAAMMKSVSASSGKQILHEMYIDFPENSITAILGPSGSGKTTLMSVLTDSLQSNIVAQGEVNLPGEMAFVPQEDQLHGFYTCKSYMKHYCRLTSVPLNAETEKEIDDLFAKLGLTDQADVIVGDLFLKGLSGGQKRRLSVALEALTKPMNFFLDEPTSGLDSESALQVMDFLKDYVRASPGRRVILTIHQPSSFIWQMIDHVVLLSKGKLMYQGPRREMEDFFAHAEAATPAGWNPADHYVTAVNDEFRNHRFSVDEWAEKYREWNKDGVKKVLTGKRERNASILKAATKEQIHTQRSSSPLVMLELTNRYFLNLWFNPGIIGTRFAMYSMLALMVGALFWGLGDRSDLESINSRAAVAYYCVAFFIFMSVAVLPFTVMERAIVDKEVMNNYYHPIMYQVSQGLASIPGAAFLALVTSVIIVPMLKLQDGGWYFLAMFLSLVVAEALAQLVSHVVPHFVIGMALVAGMYGFFMLFQGFMLVKSEFPDWLEWTYYTAFHTYAWRTFMTSEFSGREFDTADFKTGQDVLDFYQIGDVDRGSDMLVLTFYALVLHVISFAVLWLKYDVLRGSLKPLMTVDV